MSKALVIFSGGLDSTVCLLYALNKYNDVETITFDYGQKNIDEIKNAEIICNKLNVKFNRIKIESLNEISNSAMFSDNMESFFVPNRNAIFLTYAHTFAQKINADRIIIGICITGNNLPDCSKKFIESMEKTLNISSNTDIKIEIPIAEMTKDEIFSMADGLNSLDFVIDNTFTCYNNISEKHEWGYGCNKCSACEIRRKGYERFIEERNKR